MIRVSHVEFPLLQWFTQYSDYKFCSSDERGSILRLRNFSSTHISGNLFSCLVLTKTRSGLVPVFQLPEVKLAAPLGFLSSIKSLFAAHSTKHSPLDVLALYLYCTCWQLRLPAYTLRDGNTGRDVVKRHKDGGL